MWEDYHQHQPCTAAIFTQSLMRWGNPGRNTLFRWIATILEELQTQKTDFSSWIAGKRGWQPAGHCHQQWHRPGWVWSLWRHSCLLHLSCRVHTGLYQASFQDPGLFWYDASRRTLQRLMMRRQMKSWTCWTWPLASLKSLALDARCEILSFVLIWLTLPRCAWQKLLMGWLWKFQKVSMTRDESEHPLDNLLLCKLHLLRTKYIGCRKRSQCTVTGATKATPAQCQNTGRKRQEPGCLVQPWV